MTDAAAPPVAAPAAPAVPTHIPWLGVTAVLLGTFISTLNGRLSSFGLADIRGGVHAGFDDGAWITTAQTDAQMLMAPIAVWLGATFGPRRVLLAASLIFSISSIVAPFSVDLPSLLVLQFVCGASSGCFIPLTLSFILRTLPPKYWAYGIALYALNLELSLNISASLEGFYVDHMSWAWIYWQNVPLAIGMALCLHFGIARTPPGPERPRVDWYGLASLGLGLALIYAGLDQGNRLDWQRSGLVWGLLLSGALLVVAFFIHETRTSHPFLDLKVAFAPPQPRQLLLISFLRLTILSTSFLIPQYLQAVRGFRALEVGQSLFWIALPQLIFCPLAGLMLRRTDTRLVACTGFVFIAISCLMVAHGLTDLWGSDQFLPASLLQALGQSFALSGVIFYGILHLRPQDALTFGAMLQIARLMGAEIGQAFVVTLDRVRSQTASNLIGLHVQIGDWAVAQRLHTYGAITGREISDPVETTRRATTLLGGAVRTAAATQGVIDAFVAIAFFTTIALLLVVTNPRPPTGPASPMPLFPPREEKAPT
jgi:DHA2 family multidrug resistance protein